MKKGLPVENLFRWDVSRICCPSQGYFYFYDNDSQFWVLYIRWRSNPWTAELIKVTDFYADIWDWNDVENVPLKKVYEEEEECEEVMKDSYEWLKHRFIDIKFPEKPPVTMHPFPNITEEDLRV